MTPTQHSSDMTTAAAQAAHMKAFRTTAVIGGFGLTIGGLLAVSIPAGGSQKLSFAPSTQYSSIFYIAPAGAARPQVRRGAVGAPASVIGQP